MSCSNHYSNFFRKPRVSVRQVWKRKTSTPKSSSTFQNESPPFPLQVHPQSPSPPSYNPLRDKMINSLHNISTILDTQNNPSNAYTHVPPSPPLQPIYPPSHADKAILSGVDNRPPMLEKDMYDSWKRRIELYMMNRQHGRMILESIENGPLIWPSIEENKVTRPKKYYALSTTEAIQADCDIKATNIILQGLPPDVYALVSNHKVAKELWERIQLLMHGSSLKK
ncbi:hypothetical protein Tco_1345251 [Tanacetum coccineum]